MRTRLTALAIVVLLVVLAALFWSWTQKTAAPDAPRDRGKLNDESPARARLPRNTSGQRAASQKPAAPGYKGSIVGRIFTSEGVPAVDAMAEVRAPSDLAASNNDATAERAPKAAYAGRVDGEGKFTVERLPPGEYGIVARTSTEVGTATATVRGDSPRATVVTVILEPALSITGHVRSRTGDAVEGAAVSPVRRNGKPIDAALSRMLVSESDADGAFATAPLPSGRYELYASAKGYAPGKSGPVASGTTDAAIYLDGGTAVRGTVIRFETQEPVGGTIVIALAPDLFGGEERAISEADGSFAFEALAPIHYIFDIEVQDGSVLIDGPINLDLGGAPPDALRLEICTGGAIRGRIYDAALEKGLPGVHIMASHNNRFAQRYWSKPTDEEGQFELTGLRKGAYSVRPVGIAENNRGGSRLAARHVVLEAGQEIDGIDFAVESSPAVSGTVVDASGAPAAFAQVFASRASTDPRIPEWSAMSDEKGVFTFRGFSTGDELELAAFTPTAASKWAGPVRVGEDGARDVVITLGPERTGSIAGKVIDKHGRPIALEVQAIPLNNEYPYMFDTMNVNATESGAFVFAALPGGEYVLQLVRGVGNVQPAQTVRLADGERITGLVLTADTTESLTIVGHVRDSSGRAVANASISAMGFVEGGRLMYRRFATSQFDGRFELTWLPEASFFVVRATADGFAPAELAVQAGEQNAQVTLGPAPIMQGVVIDAATKKPLPHFSVAAIQSGQPADRAVFREFNDPEGRFSLPAERRTCTLSFRAPDYVPESVEAQAGTPVTVELRPGTDRIRGTVVDADNQPVAGAYVFYGTAGLYGRADGSGSRARTSADGSFELSNPPPDTNLLSASHPDFGVGADEVGRESETSATAIIRLQPLGGVTGSVRIGGKAVEGLMVLVESEFGVSLGAQTDAEGRFFIERFAPGPADVSVIASEAYQDPTEALKRHVVIEPSTPVTVDFDV